MFFLCAVGVGELHWAGAQDLEAVVEVGGWGEGLGAEGGAGVVDFDEGDWGCGAVGDRGGDVRGMASGESGQADGECEDAFGAHEVQGIRVGIFVRIAD